MSLHKKRRKRQLGGTARAEDIALVWELISEPQKHPDFGYVGARISVNVAEAARRELIVEFPFPTDKNGDYLPVTPKQTFTQAEIDKAIRLALEDGWDPGSRGKAYHFRIPD
jgi:hypothetical protein